MKKVELKGIAEFLWKGTPPDEKTPFAHQNTVPEHGSISKNLEAGDNKSSGKEFPEDGDVKTLEPMSIPRKLCFALSFNGWIIYFLMLGWVIPCRDSNCDTIFHDVFERNLTSIWPLTSLETFNVEGLPSLAMLGYASGLVLNLAAMKSVDGTFVWNSNLTFIPRRIQCNFEMEFDANGDGIDDCLLTGFNDVYAFNASNGFVFWQQNLPSEEGNIVSGFHPTKQHGKLTHLIGTCGDEVVVLAAHNGTKVTQKKWPCSSPFDIRIIPNVVNANFTFWSIVCDYGDKVETWGFREEDLLKRENSKSTGNARNEFTLLFNRESDSGGSIDLGCDVTSIPGGPLLLSWSDRVAMVTPEATVWERRFAYPLTVASIQVGHFTNAKELQVAAAFHNQTNSVVYILDITNGTTVNSVILKDREAQTLDKVAGDIDTDSLVLKSVYMNYTSNSLNNNMSDPMPMEKTNYALVHFSNNALTVKEIVTIATVVGSTVNTRKNGEADLLILTTRDGNALFHRYILNRKEDITPCTNINHESHFSSEM